MLVSDNLSAAIKAVIDTARNIAQGKIDPVFIIVPDRFTLQAEKLLLADGGCYLNTHIITFSRLFHLVHNELGGTGFLEQVLDKTSAVLFMWRAVQNVRDELLWFKRSVDHYAFAEKIFNTINQLTSSLVDFETLHKNTRADTVTAKKMHDITVIRRAYKKETSEYTDSSGQLGFLIENIKYSKQLTNSKIFITGFEHLSVQREAVITELIKKAKSVTAGVRAGSELENFISAACFDLGFAAQREKVVQSDQKLENRTETIQVNTFDSVGAEAEWAANQICALTKTKGVRFRDITVCLCDFEKSVKIWTQVFTECSIAVNADVGESLLENQFVQYLKEYLALAASGRQEHFINIIKSSYSGLGADDEFELENLALKSNMRSNQITEPYVKALKKCKTAGEFVRQLRKIKGPEIPKLDELLQIIERISDDMPLEIMQFLNLFTTLASATKVSEIPEYSDAVTLVSTAEHQPYFTEYLFIAGITEPTFPAHQDDTDIITGQDLNNIAVRIEPSCTLTNIRNKIHAVDILASFTKQCFLSSNDNESALDQIFFNIVGQSLTQQQSKSNPRQDDIASKTYATALVLRAIAEGTAYTDPIYYNSVLRSLGLWDLPLVELFGPHNNISRGQALFFKNLTGRITQIENFYKCPYYHFLQNGLSVHPREIYSYGELRFQLAPNIMGTIIHKIAEEFTNRIIKNGSLDNFNTQKEMQEAVSTVFTNRKFDFLLKDASYAPVVSGIRRESKKVAEQIFSGIKDSAYFPRFTELPLSKPFGGITLKGKADRIDTAEINGREHAVVFDYKTGSDSGFSLKKMEAGIKLQLPLYLSLLPEKYIPDGAYYLPLSGGYCFDEDNAKAHGITKNIAEVVAKSEKLAMLAIDKITRGVVAPLPADKKTCDYCLARAMCKEAL